MRYQQAGNAYFIRLERGEELIATLVDWCSHHQIHSGFLYGLGGVTSAELGYYELAEKKYHWQKHDDVVEILSLQGTITKEDDDTARMHVHAALGTREMMVVGGHVKRLVVGGTAEIKLIPGDVDIEREDDADVGLGLLDLENSHPGVFA